MIYGLGTKALRIYRTLLERILSGDLPEGAKLPPHTELAVEFGVAPMTMRHVLARLEEDGLVSREQGRGTFVRKPASPKVLIVDDDGAMRSILGLTVTQAGFQVAEAAGPEDALEVLEREPRVALVLSDIRMPDSAAGVTFIRAVRRRWPDLPVAAVTGYPDDLVGLHGTPECPVLILPKPFRANQVREILRLALRPATPAGKSRPEPDNGS